jgi:hypothetical protein
MRNSATLTRRLQNGATLTQRLRNNATLTQRLQNDATIYAHPIRRLRRCVASAAEKIVLVQAEIRAQRRPDADRKKIPCRFSQRLRRLRLHSSRCSQGDPDAPNLDPAFTKRRIRTACSNRKKTIVVNGLNRFYGAKKGGSRKSLMRVACPHRRAAKRDPLSIAYWITIRGAGRSGWSLSWRQTCSATAR